MENILEEKPTDTLYGRTLYSATFVSDDDIKNKKVLDIGCGFGWFELNAINRDVHEIIGMEISENDIKTAKKYIKNKRVSFKIGSAIDLPFDDSTFDTVVAWDVIEHIPKNTENKMFQEIDRILKDQGIFYLSTPHNSFFSKILDPAWWLIGHRHYSMQKLLYLAKKNGFKIERNIIKGGWWEIAGMSILYIAKWVFRRRPFFRSLFNRAVDREYSKSNGFNTIFVKLS